ncbi:Histidine-containing phosphotransfer protein 1-like protein [Drosera capensis]
MAAHLHKRLNDYISSLIHEGILNEQFNQLKSLQDESNPDFVVEVLSLFFDDSERLLNELAKSLDQQVVDFKKVDAHAHQFKGSSSSVGAKRVQDACMSFRWYCNQENLEGCKKCLQQLRNEYALVKSKLNILLKLEQQILAASGRK